jgi:hypothetical protein
MSELASLPPFASIAPLACTILIAGFLHVDIGSSYINERCFATGAEPFKRMGCIIVEGAEYSNIPGGYADGVM